MLPSSCSRTVPVLSSLAPEDRRGRVMPGNSNPLMPFEGRRECLGERVDLARAFFGPSVPLLVSK